jgi:hypothetical protein
VTDIDLVKLGRRFFLADTISTRPLAGGYPEILTYARELTMRVEMRSGTTQKIYPPLLVVTYNSRRSSTILGYDPNSVAAVAPVLATAALANYDSGFTAATPLSTSFAPASLPTPVSTTAQRTSAVGFTQEYRKSISGVETAAIALFWVFFVLALAWWALRVMVLRKKAGNGPLGFWDLLRYLCILCGTVAEVMFWVAFGTVAVLFLFYKGPSFHIILLSPLHDYLSRTHPSSPTQARAPHTSSSPPRTASSALRSSPSSSQGSCSPSHTYSPSSSRS